MGVLMKISSQHTQLRMNHSTNMLMGGAFLTFGFLLWSASPFLLNVSSQANVILRYVSLGTSIGCGIMSIVCGNRLERTKPLIKAMEQAEQDDFLNGMAASQYVQQQRWEQSAVAALTPPQPAYEEVYEDDYEEPQDRSYAREEESEPPMDQRVDITVLNREDLKLAIHQATGLWPYQVRNQFMPGIGSLSSLSNLRSMYQYVLENNLQAHDDSDL